MKLDNKKIVCTIGLTLFCLFGLATFFPEKWWGIHFTAFLPSFWKLSILIVAGILIIGGYFGKFNQLENVGLSNKMQFGIPILLAILFFLFPIHTDHYGDAPYTEGIIAEDFEIKTIQDHWADFLYPNIFFSKIGERTIDSFVCLVKSAIDIEIVETIRWMGLISGLLFSFLWLWLIRNNIENKPWQIILGLACLTAPFMQMFFGHIEIYAPSMLAFLAFFGVLLQYFKTSSKTYLYLLLPIYLVCAKLHITSVLLLPALGLTFWYHFQHKKSQEESLFNPLAMGKKVLLPAIGLGLFIYIVVLHQHAASRSFFEENITVADRLFLPIFSLDQAPWDRYNLLSLNHILDYFNMFLHWSPLAIFAMISILITRWQKINWKEPVLLITGTTLFFFISFFFMLNPLMSMPLDWDLYALVAVVLLSFLLVLVRQVQFNMPRIHLVGMSVGLSLFCLPAFVINSNPQMLSERLECLGSHMFNTYWYRSFECLNQSHELIKDDPKQYLSRQQNLIKKLEARAVPGSDLEYANLLMKLGSYYMEHEKEYQNALRYFKESEKYYDNHGENLTNLLKTHFYLGEFDRAHEYSNKLLEFKYPNEQKAYDIAIHCALEAELYDTAKKHCDNYLKQWPEDKTIASIKSRLEENDAVDALKNIFRN